MFDVIECQNECLVFFLNLEYLNNNLESNCCNPSNKDLIQRPFIGDTFRMEFQTKPEIPVIPFQIINITRLTFSWLNVTVTFISLFYIKMRLLVVNFFGPGSSLTYSSLLVTRLLWIQSHFNHFYSSVTLPLKNLSLFSHSLTQYSITI